MRHYLKKLAPNTVLTCQRGGVMIYLIAVMLVGGALGAGMVSLTTTSTFTELGHNASDQARYLALAGLKYAERTGASNGIYMLADGKGEFKIERGGGISVIATVNKGTFMEASFEIKGGNDYSDPGNDIDLDFPSLDFDTAGAAGNFPDRDDLKFRDNALVGSSETNFDLHIVAEGGNEQVSYDKFGSAGERTLGVGHGVPSRGRISGSEKLHLYFTGTYTQFSIMLHYFSNGAAVVTGMRNGVVVDVMEYTGSSGSSQLFGHQSFSNKPFDQLTISVSGGGVVGLKTISVTND